MSAYELASQASQVVAVIPAYNEARFIGSVVLATRRVVEIVIVVDDGSSDGTAEIAQAAGATVVRLAENQGKGAALNAGFRRALASGADAVVILDGDAQHNPEDIPGVLLPVLAGSADVVIGSRFLGTKSKIPWWRQMGQHALTKMTNAASGVKLTDSQSGFRAFSRDALERMVFHSSGLAVESEMQFQLQEGGLRWQEVPIGVSYRDGNKRNPVTHGMHIVDALLGMMSERHPLMFFAVPGGMLGGLGIGVGLWVAQRLSTVHVLSVGGAVLSLVFLIGGLLLSVTGIILHSIETLTSRLRKDMREAIDRPPPGELGTYTEGSGP